MYKIKKKSLVILLRNQPSLINEFDDNIKSKIKTFTIINWSNILKDQPSLINYCDKLNDIPMIQLIDDKDDNVYHWAGWYYILHEHPELIKYCNKLTDEDSYHCLPRYNEKLKDILIGSKKYIGEYIEKYIEKFHDPEILTYAINLSPNLKDLYTKNDLWKYVDFSKVNNCSEYTILK